MMNFKKRLDALESAEHAQPARLGRFTADVMLIYGTLEERAQWEATGRPNPTRHAMGAAINQVYHDTD